MGNPLFNTFGQNVQNGGNPFENVTNLIQNFNKFRSTFQGDPEQKVQELLNSGQMTQAQFNQLSQLAQEFQKMMKG